MAFLLLLSLFSGLAFPEVPEPDTTNSVLLQEVDILAAIKENGQMRQQPISVSLIGKQQMEAAQVTSLKGAGQLVPNLFIPDYGSRLTSAIYIRGIGSRINTPAVGLYVDDIPYADKSAFDFNFYDIERLDVLRGPQGTLYGRNTMGGLVRIYTRNPFTYQGTDAKLSYATGDGHRTISLTHYHHPTEQLAFSAGGYYEGKSGFFKNSNTGHHVDDMNAGGGRLRAIYKATDRLDFDFTTSFDYSDEGAYPYFYTGSLTNTELYPDLIGNISNNRKSSYRRSLLNIGLNIGYKADLWQMNAVTGYQNIDDRMFMDQDFIAPDIYTLEQQQHINTLTEELTFKNRDYDHWEWVTGANFMYQWLDTEAPVTFYDEGISTLIEDNTNQIFADLKTQKPNMPAMGIQLSERSFCVHSQMQTPMQSAALFHQSIFHWNQWSLTAGLRLEYEHLSLDYHSGCSVPFSYKVEVVPGHPFVFDKLLASPQLANKLTDDNIQLLPKLSIAYHPSDLDGSTIYTSISKGYRSGGYNIQMISDLVQADMRSQMMTAINTAGSGIVEQMMGSKYADLIQSADGSGVGYKPEYSWNFEAGTHLNLLERSMQVDAALFYNRIFDQQVARFTSSGLGRMMVNASRSQSCGAEASLRWYPVSQLALSGNYGYTHAAFLRYFDGKNDYTDHHVPFVPMHTFNADAAYTIQPSCMAINALTFGVSTSGSGRIYWTESNNTQQPFYATLGARISLATNHFVLTLWGRNLSDSHYNTFFFESAGRGYEQHGKPRQIGIDLSLHF